MQESKTNKRTNIQNKDYKGKYNTNKMTTKNRQNE